MKKEIFVIICLITLVLLTGCEKNLEIKESSTEKTSIIEKEEKVQNDDLNSEEISQSDSSEKEKISNNEENSYKNETTNITTTQSNQNNQKVESQTPIEKICTPKKFAHKYTYVYDNEAVCNANGNQPDAFDYFIANGITASMYGCEKIVDDCGNTYYGVYFTNTSGQKYYY